MNELVASLVPDVRHPDVRLIRIAGDLAGVVSPWLVEAIGGGQLDVSSGGFAAVSWLLAASAADTYRASRGKDPLVGFHGSLVTLALAGVIAVSIAVASTVAGWPTLVRPTPVLGFWGDLAIIAGLLVGWQRVYRRCVPPADLRHRLLILGSHASTQDAARLLEDALPFDCDVIGCVGDDSDNDLGHSASTGAQMVGTVEQLVELVRGHRASRVVVADHGVVGDRMLQRIADARAQGTQITTVFEFYRATVGRLPLEDAPAFRLAALTAGGEELESYAPIKRLIDISLSTFGLMALALVIPFIALANAIDSPGPLFYAQTRIGRAGRTFSMFKLRSMFVDAERPGEVEWSRQNDPRITRIGRLLRKSHLDETPQFWNIVTGDMSLVGPRPERPEFVRTLRAEIPCYSARHAVRPGLTGWAQVNYSYGNTQRDALIKLEYDLYYVQHRGLRLDLQCMLRTIQSVVLLRGT